MSQQLDLSLLKPKTFNYYKDIKVPTFEAIERIKER